MKVGILNLDMTGLEHVLKDEDSPKNMYELRMWTQIKEMKKFWYLKFKYNNGKLRKGFN